MTDGDLTFFNFVFVAFFAGALGIPYWFYRKERRRGGSFRTVAEGLGLTYCSADTEIGALGLVGFEATHDSQARARHVIEGTYQGAEVKFSEVVYYHGGGRYPKSHHRIVAKVTSEDLILPCFCVRRTKMPDHVRGSDGNFDLETVGFDEDLEFTGTYTLRADDKAFARTLFSPAVRAFFRGRPALWGEGANKTIVLVGEWKLQHPDIQAHLDAAITLMRLLSPDADPLAGLK